MIKPLFYMKLITVGYRMFGLLRLVQFDEPKSNLQLPRRWELLFPSFSPSFMLSFWCTFLFQKCPPPLPADAHCLCKYACICRYMLTEMFRISIKAFSRQAGEKESWSNQQWIASGILDTALSSNPFIIEVLDCHTVYKSSPSPRGLRNNRVLNYHGIYSYHMSRAYYVVNALHELCQPLIALCMLLLFTFTDGEIEFRKVRQLPHKPHN